MVWRETRMPWSPEGFHIVLPGCRRYKGGLHPAMRPHATQLQSLHLHSRQRHRFKMVAILGHLTRVIAGVSVPNSPMVNATIAFAQENLPLLTYNHVMRAWLNGQAIINKLPAANLSRVDQEAYAVGAILHDMGFSNNSEFISSDKRFEVDGANVGQYSNTPMKNGKCANFIHSTFLHPA
jgi:hypothetical protein